MSAHKTLKKETSFSRKATMNFTNSTFNSTLLKDTPHDLLILWPLLLLALLLIGLLLAADELHKHDEEFYSRLPGVHLMKTIKSDAPK